MDINIDLDLNKVIPPPSNYQGIITNIEELEKDKHYKWTVKQTTPPEFEGRVAQKSYSEKNLHIMMEDLVRLGHRSGPKEEAIAKINHNRPLVEFWSLADGRIGRFLHTVKETTLIVLPKYKFKEHVYRYGDFHYKGIDGTRVKKGICDKDGTLTGSYRNAPSHGYPWSDSDLSDEQADKELENRRKNPK